MKRKLTISLLMLVHLCLAYPAYAVPITLHFTATGITPAWHSIAPSPAVPQSTVTGTIVYEAVDVHSPIQSITSIDLTISGHAYTTSELAFRSQYQIPGGFIIGGSLWGAEAMGAGGDGKCNDDFYLSWHYPASPFTWEGGTTSGPVGFFGYMVKDFTYTLPGDAPAPYVFWTSNFSSFSIAP